MITWIWNRRENRSRDVNINMNRAHVVTRRTGSRETQYTREEGIIEHK